MGRIGLISIVFTVRKLLLVIVTPTVSIALRSDSYIVSVATDNLQNLFWDLN